MRRAISFILSGFLALPAFAMHAEPLRTSADQPGTKTPAAKAPVPVPEGNAVHREELPGGLIIEDLKLGDGAECKPNQLIVAYYHGTLRADPSVVFDSAFERGEPATFSLDPAHPTLRVIQGWQKGIPGMKVGGVRRITIPAAMAYGSQARGPKIPANSDLVFVIQLEASLSLDNITIEDIKIGEGETAASPCIAVTAQVVRGADGKELAKNDAAHPYIWVPGEMFLQGLNSDVMQHGLTGMKVGGTRKVTIPKDMNVGPPQVDVNRPLDVPVTFEIELIAVRNLPQQGQRR